MKRLTVLAVAALALGACQTAQVEKTKPVTKPMAPAAMPASLPYGFNVGDKVKYLWNGADTEAVVTKLDGKWATRSIGTRGNSVIITPNFVTPPKYWKQPTSEGEARVISGNPDSLWPLKVGNSVSFEVSGKNLNRGTTWKNTYSCKVEGQENVTTKAGTHDAYKVSCNWGSGRWYTKRTYYYAPGIGQLLKYVSSGNSSTVYEYVGKAM